MVFEACGDHHECFPLGGFKTARTSQHVKSDTQMSSRQSEMSTYDLFDVFLGAMLSESMLQISSFSLLLPVLLELSEIV